MLLQGRRRLNLEFIPLHPKSTLVTAQDAELGNLRMINLILTFDTARSEFAENISPAVVFSMFHYPTTNYTI
jgi:hypothetical protein